MMMFSNRLMVRSLWKYNIHFMKYYVSSTKYNFYCTFFFYEIHLIIVVFFPALLLLLPGGVWVMLQSHPCIPLQCIINTAKQCYKQSSADQDLQNQLTKFLGKTLNHHLSNVKVNRKYAQLGTLCNNYLTLSYIITQVLYFVMTLINTLTVMQYVGSVELQGLLGAQRVEEDGSNNNVTTTPQTTSDIFPSTVLCQYQIRHQSRVHQYLTTCFLEHDTTLLVLSLTAIWFSILCVVHLANLFRCTIWAVLIPYCGYGGGSHEVQCAFASLDVPPPRSGSEASEFVAALGRDGVLISHLVNDVSSGAIAASMLAEAYKEFRGDAKPKSRNVETKM